MNRLHNRLNALTSSQSQDALSAAGERKNILLIRFKSIGDVLFTLPAVHVIRESFPHATITFLTSRENVSLIEGFRDVDRVLGLDRSVYHSGNPGAIVSETFSLFQQLRTNRFWLTVDFQGYGETGLITWLSRAKNRWGSVYRPVRGWAYTRAIKRENELHPANWNLSLLRQCGLNTETVRNEFVLSDSAADAAREFLVARGLNTTKPMLFVQPFTSSLKKSWALENFLAVAAHWRTHGMQILFGGGPKDGAALAPAIEAGFPVSAGVPLLTTAGLMKLSTLVIGGDTGLLHLAVAMNKRVVMLMPSVTRSRFHPFQHPDWMITPPDEKTISSISPEIVIRACKKAFNETL